MFFNDATIFFSDFAVQASLLHIMPGHKINGILKTSPFSINFNEAQLAGRNYTWIVSEQEIIDVEVGHLLRIEGHDYQVLQKTVDGTGLAYLTLERI